MKIKTNLKIPAKINKVNYIIDHVANYLSGNFTFAYYERSDIKQESWIICMEAIKDYNGSVPLENFLIIHLKNRLINLQRDKYNRQTVHRESRKALMNPAPEIDLSSDNCIGYSNPNMSESLEYEELDNLIINNIDYMLIDDYIKLRDGSRIPEKKRLAIQDAVHKILSENQYEAY